MKENNKNVFIITLLILIIICLTFYICYDKLIIKTENNNILENNNTLNNKQNDNINNNLDNTQKEIILPKDKVAFSIERYNDKIISILYALGDDENLYYYLNTDTSKDLEKDYIYSYNNSDLNGSKFMEENLIKYKDLNNIKRIMGTNTTSTGTSFNLLAITNDGKVFSIWYDYTQNKFTLNIISDFSKYNVDEIIYYKPAIGCIKGNNCSSKFKIKTTDGKIIEDTISHE